MSKKQSALVVDDQINWRDLIKEILSIDGYEVSTASNFRDAMDLINSKEYNLAVLDMRLLDDYEYNVEGIKVLQEIKKIQPSITAIILTGYPDKIQEKRAKEIYHADDYLEKVPKGKKSIDIKAFRKRVNELM